MLRDRRTIRFGLVDSAYIHPAIVPLLNEGFRPSQAEIESAERIIAAFDEAERSGRAPVEVDGKMNDIPAVERAERLLARAGRVRAKPSSSYPGLKKVIMIKPKRTWLFAPGMDERKMSKAASSEADALIFDLEDAVAISEKPRARSMVRELLEQQSPTRQIYVRINDVTTGWTAEDLRAVCVRGLAGVVVPKVEAGETVRTVSTLIETCEREAGLPSGQVRLNAIIESARAVVQIASIAEAGGRLDMLMFGAGDYTADLAIPTANVGPHILHAKVVTVVASRAARLAAPIDTVFFDIADPDGFAADCEEAKALGFQGKAIIHPNQVEDANRTFTPSTAEITSAKRLVETFEEAERNGVGAVQIDGKLVDHAMLKTARKTLALARALHLT